MYCPNCGKEYINGQNFCRYCGCNLNEEFNYNKQPDDIHSENKSLQNTNNDNIENSDIDNSVIPQKDKKNILPQECTDKSFERKSEPFGKLIDKKQRTINPIFIIAAVFVIVIAVFEMIQPILKNIDAETQINTSQTEEYTRAAEDYNENYEINAPGDEEENIYANAPHIPENEKIIQEKSLEDISKNSDNTDIQMQEENPSVNDGVGNENQIQTDEALDFAPDIPLTEE